MSYSFPQEFADKRDSIVLNLGLLGPDLKPHYVTRNQGLGNKDIVLIETGGG